MSTSYTMEAEEIFRFARYEQLSISLFKNAWYANVINQIERGCLVCYKPCQYRLLRGKRCLDFVEGLPVSSSFNCILVVVHFFTKYAHFVGLKHTFTALTVAKAFISNIYKLHGLPQVIISDRDNVCTSLL